MADVQTISEVAQGKLTRELEGLEEWRRGYFKHLPHLVTMLELFPEKDGFWHKLDSYSVWVHVYKVEDINEELKRIYPLMRKAGFKPPSSGFDLDGLTWRWHFKGDYDKGTVVFYLSLADEGKCKKVCIGTKEVEVFEIQCNDGAIEAPVDEDNEEGEDC